MLLKKPKQYILALFVKCLYQIYNFDCKIIVKLFNNLIKILFVTKNYLIDIFLHSLLNTHFKYIIFMVK